MIYPASLKDVKNAIKKRPNNIIFVYILKNFLKGEKNKWQL